MTALTVSALDENIKNRVCLKRGPHGHLSREEVEYTWIDIMTVHLAHGNHL